MNEARRLRVAKLAMAESRARQHFEALGAVNVSPLTAKEREDLDTEYEVARAEWGEALDALRAEVSGPTLYEWPRGQYFASLR